MACLYIVDDQPDTHIILARLLELDGYTVVGAHNGSEALKQIPLVRPALVLLDLALPGIDGLTVAKQLRTNSSTKHLPIIAMTAFGSNEYRSHAIAAGCSEYLLKPLDFVKLRSMIAQLVLQVA
ncbi:response regulator [Herpetosiphon sp. NSE202]|uniref:response regulator n=1 Tax=Herpetosiphon sp. NSE202 TaxID=3351349 RepID=UPI003634BDBD